MDPRLMQSDPPRVDVYGPIHKALRRELCLLVVRLGTAANDDEEQRTALMQDTRAVLDLCSRHLEHEDTFTHPALNARVPAASARQDEEHEHHARQIRGLLHLVARVEATDGPERARFFRELYLAFTEFVGDSLVHMAQEERRLQPQLHATHSDAELHDLEHRIVASISPELLIVFLRAMVPALSPAERFTLLEGMKGASAATFGAVLEAVRPTLPAAEWDALAKQLRFTN